MDLVSSSLVLSIVDIHYFLISNLEETPSEETRRTTAQPEGNAARLSDRRPDDRGAEQTKRPSAESTSTRAPTSSSTAEGSSTTKRSAAGLGKTEKSSSGASESPTWAGRERRTTA